MMCPALWFFWRRARVLFLVCLLSGSVLAQTNEFPRSTLQLGQVLASITNQYPPLLAALIERDIAAGRLKSAEGTFDFNVFARLFGTPAGYYQSGTVDTGFEQFTGIWGSTVFGGYRLTRGDVLPDYYNNRTEGGGEVRFGLRVPLLRDGAIDRRRAAVLKARLDKELADPFIQRQQLDFIRAGTVAYYNWQAAGERLRVIEGLFRIANERTSALTNQVSTGLLPRIVLTDNQRLVVARQLGVVQARRRFEAASLALSLFFRTSDDEPVIAQRDQLPEDFPEVGSSVEPRLEVALDLAVQNRPEIVRLELAGKKLAVDRRLAQNQLRPNLDAGAVASQDFGEKIYADKAQFELQAGLEFRMPLQRNEAKGRLAEIEGQIEQLSNEQRMAQDRIRNETRDAFSALTAAHEQTQQAKLNVELARELQAGEAERFRRGASDLLALQIREQALFDAQILEVDAYLEYFRALADYRAATAADLASIAIPTAMNLNGP